MPISPFGQTLELLQKSRDILVVFPELASADSLGPALALAKTLDRLGKTAVIASSAAMSPKYQFLPGLEFVKSSVDGGGELVLSVSTEKNGVRSLRYEKKDDRLLIVLTPEKDRLLKEQVLIRENQPPQIIVAVKCADLDDLGALKNNNPKFFLQLPLINIDHRPANLNYGTVNLVDLSASSAAEIVWRLIKDLSPEPVDKDDATCLLAGIIEATRSFRSAAAKPRSFIAASDLIELGADRELIIRSLYKTKTLAALKILGEMLDKMEFHAEQKLVFINLAESPSNNAREALELVGAALEELKEIFPSPDMIFALWPAGDGRRFCFLSERPEELFKIARALDGKIATPVLAEGQLDNRAPEEIKQAIFKSLRSSA